MAEQRKAAVETSSFEPLLCDSRGVLGIGRGDQGGGGKWGCEEVSGYDPVLAFGG